jgi:hypothetical protein
MHHEIPSKAFLYSNRSKLEQILATSLRRKNENKKRERERSGRDLGIVTVAENRCETREGRHSFILGAKSDPSWMSSKCHTSKRNRASQGGVTFGFW